MTKAIQKTSDTLQIVADLYDDHVRANAVYVRRYRQGKLIAIACFQARRTQLVTHEAFKNVAHPSTLYAV